MQADTPKIAPDPNLAAQQTQAQTTLINNLQTEAQMDTANVMSRFGTMLALKGAGTPIAPPTAAPTTAPIRF